MIPIAIGIAAKEGRAEVAKAEEVVADAKAVLADAGRAEFGALVRAQAAVARTTEAGKAWVKAREALLRAKAKED